MWRALDMSYNRIGGDYADGMGRRKAACYETGRSYAKLGRFRIEAIPKFTRRPLEKDGNGLILKGCIDKC